MRSRQLADILRAGPHPYTAGQSFAITAKPEKTWRNNSDSEGRTGFTDYLLHEGNGQAVAALESSQITSPSKRCSSGPTAAARMTTGSGPYREKDRNGNFPDNS